MLRNHSFAAAVCVGLILTLVFSFGVLANAEELPEVSHLYACQFGNGILVRWTEPQDPEEVVAGYKVYLDSGEGYGVEGEFVAKGRPLHIICGLEPGNYKVKVTTVGVSGEETESPETQVQVTAISNGEVGRYHEENDGWWIAWKSPGPAAEPKSLKVRGGIIEKDGPWTEPFPTIFKSGLYTTLMGYPEVRVSYKYFFDYPNKRSEILEVEFVDGDGGSRLYTSLDEKAWKAFNQRVRPLPPGKYGWGVGDLLLGKLTWPDKGGVPKEKLPPNGNVGLFTAIVITFYTNDPEIKPLKEEPGTGNGAPGDPKAVYADDVNITNGNMFISPQDLFIPGRGLPIQFTRTYNSQDDYEGPLGYAWTHSYNVNLEELENGTVVEMDEDGTRRYFKKEFDDTYITPTGNYSALTKNEDDTFTLIRKHGTRYDFDTNGKLTSITDRNGNQITLSYTLGLLTTIADASGREVTLSYNGDGRIVSLTDSAARTVLYSYENGNLVSVRDQGENTTSYEYNEDHNLTVITDANGNHTYFEYDEEDRAIQFRNDADNNKRIFDYDPENMATTMTDSRGNQTIFTYNEDSVVTQIEDALGNITTHTWDENINRTSTTNANNNTTSFAYDERGNVTKITDPLGNEAVFTYDSTYDLVTSITNPLGHFTSYEYDSRGNFIQVQDAAENIISYVYNQHGQLISLTDAENHQALYEYDQHGNLAKSTDPLENETVFTYDILGNPTSTTDARGKITSYTYDQLNRPTKTTYSDQTNISYTYDAVGNRTSVTDPKSHTTQYTYNVVNRLIQVADALNQKTTYSYDTEGNRTVTTDANNTETTYEHDVLNRLISETFADNESKTYEYDEVGNLVHMTDQNGNVISNTYDDLNRLVRRDIARAPDIVGTTLQTFAYDALSRMTSATDNNDPSNPGDDSLVGWGYDAASQVLSETLKIGSLPAKTVAYSYDGTGNKTSITYPGSTDVLLAYTPTGRLDTVTRNGITVADYGYDERERVVEKAFGNGVILTNTIDNRRRIKEALYTKDSTLILGFSYGFDKVGNKLYEKNLVHPEKSQQYLYDAVYQLVEYKEGLLADGAVANPLKKKEWTLDALGNWLETAKYLTYIDDFNRDDTSGQRQDVGGLFTENGSLKSRITGSMLELRRSNNGKFELPALLRTEVEEGMPVDIRSTFSFDKGSPNEEPISAGLLFGYQDAENYYWAGAKLEKKKEYWVIGRTSGGAHSVLEEVQADIPHDTDLSVKLLLDGNEALLYEGDDQRLATAIPATVGLGGLIGTQNKTLADDFRMTTKVSETRVHNAVNELIQRDNTDLLYDENGNLTDDGMFHYSWDAFNRLVEVALSSDPSKVIAKYSYDAMNRRAQKIISNSGDLDGTTKYIYSGWQVIEERDENDNVLRTYTYGSYIDEPITMTNSTDTYYYHTNTLYSVAAITDSSGDIVEQYQYTAYGKPTILDDQGQEIATSAIGNPYLFTGRRLDPETGLYYYRYRYYSAVLGRFVGRDLMGYGDGMNLYAYVRNNPCFWLDSLGLAMTETQRRAFLSRYARILRNQSQRGGITDVEALARFVDAAASFHSGAFFDDERAFVDDVSAILGGVEGRFAGGSTEYFVGGFGQSSFESRYQDEGPANQVRHFAGSLLAGYYWESVLGRAAVAANEIRGVATWPDWRLGARGVDLGVSLSWGSFGLRLSNVANWIRENLAEAP